MDRRGADVVADGVHALVVALAQRLVVLVGVGRLGQLGGQADLLQRLLDDDVEVLVVLVVDARAHRGVQRRQDLVTLGLLGRDRDPDRLPRLLEAFAVLLGQVFLFSLSTARLITWKLHLDVAHLLDLEDPARRDPAPRAQRVEPETGDRLLGHG